MSHSKEGAKLIDVGYISGFYGVKGWVKVFSDTEPKENILKYSPWMIKTPDKGWVEISVLDGRLQGKGVVAKLEGFHDKNQVLHLLKAKIAIAEDQLPACDDGEYYWRDLIGFNVNNISGLNLGLVEGVIETGAHDVMRVTTPDKQEILVPWVHDVYIIEVNTVLKSITIDWELDYIE